MYLYIRDTDLYGSQARPPAEPANQLADISSDTESTSSRDDRVNQWKTTRRQKFAKHEKYLAERRAEEMIRLRREDERTESFVTFQKRRKERFDKNPSVEDLRKQVREKEHMKKAKNQIKNPGNKYARYHRHRGRKEPNDRENNKKTELDPTVNQIIASDAQQPTDPGQAGPDDAGADGGAGAGADAGADVGGDGGGGA